MGLIDFVKDAGEKLFGRGQAQAAAREAEAEPSNAAKAQAANRSPPTRFSSTSNRSILPRPDSP